MKSLDLFGNNDAEPAEGLRPHRARRGAEEKQAPSNAALVAIYADESCLGNGREGSNPGGAGGVIELVDASSGALQRSDYWVSEPATTNNRMALRSVIEAFGELSRMDRPFRVVFTSDSKYIVEGMRSWVAGWISRGWRRKGGPIENLALWKQATAAVLPFECQWNWVRGHNGQPQNEYANHLATRAAAEQSNSGGIIPSEFDSWLAACRTGKNGFRETAPFPEPRTFKPSPREWTI
ncbi:MAG TPA: ribonuclease H [Gemmatimonadaceae bacterium]|nr:ribonuclease H [Gemmatimonadaceae bacterium]